MINFKSLNKKLFLSIFVLCVMVISGCASQPKIPIQILTWEYIGDDCLSVEGDFSDIKTLKSWLDFNEISLPDAKGLVVSRIISSDIPQSRKYSLLSIVSMIEVSAVDYGKIEDSAIRLTASQYIDYILEAYEVAC